MYLSLFIKYLYLKNFNPDLKIPFDLNKLEGLSEMLMKVKQKIQYKDNKFRLIHTMNNMLSYNNLTLSYYITSFKAPLNIIINKINEHNIYLSYI